jgi:rubrerythrin
MEENRKTFRKELEELINRHSKENGSSTPDYILAMFLDECLSLFDRAVGLRSIHYGTEKVEEIMAKLMADHPEERKGEGSSAALGGSLGQAKTPVAQGHYGYGTEGHDFFLCTKCGYTGLTPTCHYCPSCGREIDWTGVCAGHPAGEHP